MKRHSWKPRANHLRWCAACGMYEAQESRVTQRGYETRASLVTYFVRDGRDYVRCGECPGPTDPPPKPPVDLPHDPLRLLRDVVQTLD